MKIGIVVGTDGTIDAVRSDDPTVEVAVCHEELRGWGDAAFRKAWARDYTAINALPYEVWE